MKMNLLFREEAGYSLAETSVALTLLVIALVPLASFSVGLFANSHPRRSLTAQALAQELMEETLATNRFASLDTLYHKGQWRAVRKISIEDDLVLIRIKVSPANRLRPTVEFLTIRQAPSEE